MCEGAGTGSEYPEPFLRPPPQPGRGSTGEGRLLWPPGSQPRPSPCPLPAWAPSLLHVQPSPGECLHPSGPGPRASRSPGSRPVSLHCPAGCAFVHIPAWSRRFGPLEPPCVEPDPPASCELFCQSFGETQHRGPILFSRPSCREPPPARGGWFMARRPAGGSQELAGLFTEASQGGRGHREVRALCSYRGPGPTPPSAPSQAAHHRRVQAEAFPSPEVLPPTPC